ncbi:hypothetical protein GCM10012275_31230 [Longimycelium tulufanense]|uniref:non-specific serine/threonine protein kinase n=1 Tax=Longimycelium tulufanense TaxID=907463 RepID=A0A8J3CFG2_9PSEU|nr:serine/threonine-protein kinase [Longimycelium tulufanense]GGM57769.1 hypothetical protein GCM10012275_31230 [Longimycelium tulufanense]
MHGPDTSTALIGGRYRLDSTLGRGGMGTVWRAFDEHLRRPVAIKLLDDSPDDPSVRTRFLREAQAAARLSHRNVVSVHDSGEDNGRPFLVMELLEGDSLSNELARRGPLPIDEVRDVAVQATAGLSAAWALGIVHRDVKPGNLFRTVDGTVKVLDFGIARIADDAATRLTQDGTVLGTVNYLAPEQARGRATDARTDLYSLGCVLYELLCGRPPFTGGIAEVMYAHVNTPPDAPSTLRPDVPEDLAQLVLALLAKSPDQRPDPDAFQAALSAGAGDGTLPLSALPQPPAATVSYATTPPTLTAPAHPPTAVLTAAEPPPRSRRALLIAGPAVVLVGALLLAFVLTRGDNQSTGQPNAVSGPSASQQAPINPVNTPPTTTPDAPEPAPPTVADIGTFAWISQLEAALSSQEQQGGISAKAAQEIRKKLNEARKKLGKNERSDAVEEFHEIAEDIAESRQEGKLRPGPLIDFIARSGLGG